MQGTAASRAKAAEHTPSPKASVNKAALETVSGLFKTPAVGRSPIGRIALARAGAGRGGKFALIRQTPNRDQDGAKKEMEGQDDEKDDTRRHGKAFSHEVDQMDGGDKVAETTGRMSSSGLENKGDLHAELQGSTYSPVPSLTFESQFTIPDQSTLPEETNGLIDIKDATQHGHDVLDPVNQGKSGKESGNRLDEQGTGETLEEIPDEP